MSQVKDTGADDQREPTEPAALLDYLNKEIRSLQAQLEKMGVDPQRADWETHQRALNRLRERWSTIHRYADQVRRDPSHPLLQLGGDTRTTLCDWLANDAAWHGGELAARIGLAGQDQERLRILKKSAAIATDGQLAEELEAAEREPEVFAALLHGRWLHRHNRFAEATKVAAAALRKARQFALKDALKEVLNAPQAISGAPALASVNGVGFSMFGRRDEREDGSYIATHCFIVAFIPLFPVAAYRVERQGQGYLFHGKVPLSPIAVWWRRLLALALLATCVGVGLNVYFGSEDYKASQAVAAAQEQEQAGDTDAALRAYRQVLNDYDQLESPPKDALQQAGLGTVRIAAVAVKVPPSARDLKAIEGVVAAHDSLPLIARPRATEWLAGQLTSWASAIGRSDVDHAGAQVQVMDMAAELTTALPDAVNIPLQDAHLALARLLQKDAPLAAFEHYDLALGQPGAVEEMGAILQRFGDAPSLWVHYAEAVEHWVVRARPDHAALVERIVAKQAAAVQRFHEDSQIIEKGDAAKLKAALAEHPTSQELALAVAQLEQHEGRADAALAVLQKVAEPTMMTPVVRLGMASVSRQLGDLAAAGQHYQAVVRQRLPHYKSASRQYQRRYQTLSREYWEAIVKGPLDDDLASQIDGLSEQAQQQVASEWVQRKVASDPAVAQLRARIISMEHVVTATIALGSVQLQRARQLSGSERQRMLQQAEASMLAMQAAAEGLPSYHLSMGEVYHRLGRAEQGDRHLNQLLQDNDPEMALIVGHVYRDLGNQKRARELFEGAHTAASDEAIRYEAAHARALAARDLDDEYTWLQRSNPKQQAIQASLATSAAWRALENGDIAEADRQQAKAVRINKAAASDNAAAANNAALALTLRYSLTGDRVHVTAATELLERAHRLQPNDPIVIGNLAFQLRYHGTLEVLDTQLKVDPLAPSWSDASQLVRWLLRSSRASTVLAALRKNPRLRRSLTLWHQQQALAPQNPSPYNYELSLLADTEDVAGMRALQARLKQIPALRLDDTIERRREFESGTLDDRIRRSMSGVRLLADRAEASANRSGDPVTVAAAQLLLAAHFDELADLNGGAGIDNAVSHSRTAFDKWPDPGTQLALADALVDEAFVAAGKESPALEAALKAHRRRLGSWESVIGATRSAQRDEVLVALRAEPKLAEALQLAVGACEQTKTVAPRWAYYAASWLQDSDARRRLLPTQAQPIRQLELEIQLLIYAGEDNERARLASWLAIDKL